MLLLCILVISSALAREPSRAPAIEIQDTVTVELDAQGNEKILTLGLATSPYPKDVQILEDDVSHSEEEDL